MAACYVSGCIDKVRHGYYFTTFIIKTLRCLRFRSPYATDHESPVRPSTGAGPGYGWPIGASLEPPGLPSARRDGANSDAAVAG